MDFMKKQRPFVRRVMMMPYLDGIPVPDRFMRHQLKPLNEKYVEPPLDIII
jgi:hypothetical protein